MDAPPSPVEPAPNASSPYALLPAFFTGPLGLLWCWVAPLVLLLSLNSHAWWVVQGNLDAGQRGKALTLGAFLLANLVIGIALTVESFVVARRGSPGPGLRGELLRGGVVVVTQVSFLWWVVANADACLPDNVQAWIYPTERLIFNQFLCAMPALFLGLLRISATQARPDADSKASWIALFCAVGAPVVFYFAVHVLFMAGPGHSAEVLVYFFGAFLVVFGILMFVGVLRLTLGLLRLLREGRRGPEIVCVAVFALAVPVCGLLLNRTIPFPVTFQDPAVYALTVVNALVLGWVSWTRTVYPRLNYTLLLLCFPFTLYFFVVFLPYTPLSILAVIVFGLGFLVLAPTFLFALHVGLVARASQGLRGIWPGWKTLAVGAACLLVTPAFLTLRGLADRQALGAAMRHVFTPEVKAGEARFHGDVNAARRAILNYRAFNKGIRHPFLSDYYEWLVFDSLMLSERKLATLEAAFLTPAELAAAKEQESVSFLGGGRREPRQLGEWARRPGPPPPCTAVAASPVTSVAEAGTGTSLVTVGLPLSEAAEGQSEFAVKFRLPSSVVVRGLRLGAPGSLVAGRIFERKTALHVYSMIRDTERRDPAILLLDGQGGAELRVYPVIHDKPCLVEVDLLVPAGRAAVESALASASPGDIGAAARAVASAAAPAASILPGGEVCISGLDTNCSAGPRPARVWLRVVVDRSAANAFTGAEAERVAAALRARFGDSAESGVSLCNRDVVSLPGPGDLAAQLSAEGVSRLPAGGGLFSELALAKALLEYRDSCLDNNPASRADLPPAPVIVLLGQRPPSAPVLDFARAWFDLVPSLQVYTCDANGVLTEVLAERRESTVLVRKGASLRWVTPGLAVRFPSSLKDQPLQVLEASGQWRDLWVADTSSQAPDWASALRLLSQSQDRRRNPGMPAAEDTLASLVRTSRETGVLLPQTSYIVVENEAQWRMLELLEKQKLGANEALDFKRTPAPSALWVGAGLVCWLGLRRMRRRRDG